MDEQLQVIRPRFKNVIAIAGLETLKDKNGVPYKWAATFMNNVETWIKDNWVKRSGGKALWFDARNYRAEVDPLGSLLAAVVAATKAMPDGLDALFYTGHGDMDALYVFSKTRPELPNNSRFITMEFPAQDFWSQLNWSKLPGRGIWLATCRAGGDDRKWDKCIAQHLATMSGITTWAFTCRCSQKQRADRGYYQKPDRGSYVAFTP